MRAPLGLSAIDEFYLWGLLGLTFAQPEPTVELRVTPHYVLRQLGKLGTNQKHGGSLHQQFRESLRRLSATSYESDSFYDPVRCEHRHVSFGFLSFSLPLSDRSSRAWRIAWDPIFFDFCQATGGRLFFDLKIYQRLDAASRRLFLFLAKQFWRKPQTAWLDVGYVGYEVLGFSRQVTVRDLKATKLRRVMELLAAQEIVTGATTKEPAFRKSGKGRYEVCFRRGNYFLRKQSHAALSPESLESPVAEQLRELGVDERAIRGVMRRYPAAMLGEWIDITLAARERFGEGFFRTSAAAYLVDNLQQAANSTRTPPDWWRELRKQEFNASSATPGPLREVLRTVTQRTGSDSGSRSQPRPESDAEFRQYLHGEGREACSRLFEELFAEFLATGENPHTARTRAASIVRHHLQHQWKLTAS